MYVASFDIGKKNFAFVVEEIDDTTLINSIGKCPERKTRYNKDGSANIEYMNFLEDVVFKSSRIVLHRNVDLTNGVPSETATGVKRKVANGKGCASLDHLIFLEMYKLLDEHKDVWDKCDWFLVEQQMSFGAKVNSMALKLGQHCISYFISRYMDTKNIVEFPSYHKTKVLGAPGKMDKPQRKKWAIDMAMYILCQREEFEWAQEIVNSSKRDDLSDVIVQLQAWKVLYFFDDVPL